MRMTLRRLSSPKNPLAPATAAPHRRHHAGLCRGVCWMASSHATCPAPVQPTPFQHATDAGDRVGGRAWQVSSSTEYRCTKAKAGAGSGLRDITCCATQVCAAGPPMVLRLGPSLTGPPWVPPIGGGDSLVSLTDLILGPSMFS